MAELEEGWAQLQAAREAFEREKAAFISEMKDGNVEVKLFVGNIDPSTTDEEVQALFAPFGMMGEAPIILKDSQGNSKRSAFVKYFTHAAANAAIAAVHEKVTDKGSQQPMVVRFAKPKQAPMFGQPQVAAYGQAVTQGAFNPTQGYHPYGGPAETTTGRPSRFSNAPGTDGTTRGRGPEGANLYVNYVPIGTTTAQFNKMFSEYGPIVSCRLYEEKGYGFISYNTALEAQTAISNLNGLVSPQGGRAMEVSLKKPGTAARNAALAAAGHPPPRPGQVGSYGSIAANTLTYQQQQVQNPYGQQMMQVSDPYAQQVQAQMQQISDPYAQVQQQRAHVVPHGAATRYSPY